MFFELIERATEQLAKNLPFVLYRKPNDSNIHGIFQNDAQLHYVNDFTETGFVFAPFDTESPIPLLQINEKYLANYEPSDSSMRVSNLPEIDDSQKEFHINLVKKGIEQIQEGDFKKVVLSRKVEVVCDSSSIDLFQKLLANYETVFCYIWFHPKTGLWLGATPEILLKVENQQLTTMSLAGTQKYIENENPNWGTKELEEQNLVTQYISSAIKGSVSDLKISDRTSVRAGNLWHLRTKLMGKLSKGKLSEIVKALHPTPAVCGMPMAHTKAFIAKHENYNREYYTGYLGELNFTTEKDRTAGRRNQENKVYRSIKTNTTLFVNLRCMQLKGNTAQIYVGGGVTQGSDPENEWEETVAKSNTMLQVLVSSNGK